MPCGKKKNSSAASQSHMVVGPLAAMTGTMLRFAMATTESHVRSHTPRARSRRGTGTSVVAVLVAISSLRGASTERANRHALFLRCCEDGANFGKALQVLVNVLACIHHADGPF